MLENIRGKIRNHALQRNLVQRQAWLSRIPNSKWLPIPKTRLASLIQPYLHTASIFICLQILQTKPASWHSGGRNIEAYKFQCRDCNHKLQVQSRNGVLGLRKKGWRVVDEALASMSLTSMMPALARWFRTSVYLHKTPGKWVTMQGRLCSCHLTTTKRPTFIDRTGQVKHFQPAH